MTRLLVLVASTLLLVGCHHFPRVPVTRSVPSGQTISLSHNRVCSGENDPIQVTFTPDSALTWSLNNESGQSVKTGTTGSGFVLDTKDLIEARYELAVKIDDDTSLVANFEVFHCAN